MYKLYYIWGKRILKKLAESKNYQKVRGHRHYTDKYWGAVHSICNLEFNVPNQISVVFGSGSTYDYHFSIKELAKEFEEQFEYFGGKHR